MRSIWRFHYPPKQAKADKLQRKALDKGKTKKAEKVQDKADQKAAFSARSDDPDYEDTGGAEVES